MHNVFEGDKTKSEPVIAHDAMNGIVENAQRLGSMKAAVEAYGLQHGIENIGTLFPDAKALSNQPELFGRRMEWVDALLSGTRKSPFSRIKSLWADITGDEARAKGYITGALKKEEFFTVEEFYRDNAGNYFSAGMVALNVAHIGKIKMDKEK